MRSAILDLLRCPSCHALLTLEESTSHVRAVLYCRQCPKEFPLVNGVPRFVESPRDHDARRTQASFGYEWTHFNDWRQSGGTNFNDYFQALDLESLRGRLVLDAGCGMGRHARQVAHFAGHVIAADFSAAVEQAARNTADLSNVDCIQADIFALPLADESFDFAYSLGVLHHLADTEGALAGLIAKLKPGGRLRIYLYWNKKGWQGRLLQCVTAARQVTTRLPFPMLRTLCWILSLMLYGLVVLPYRALSRVGFSRHQHWPLAAYEKYPFNVLYNDQFDRFSAPIEKRYDRDQVVGLLESAGLTDVRVYPCFGWIADGLKPS